MQDLAAAGVAGLVVPDLPLEEIEALLTAAAKAAIDVTLLVATDFSGGANSGHCRPGPGVHFTWSALPELPACAQKSRAGSKIC